MPVSHDNAGSNPDALPKGLYDELVPQAGRYKDMEVFRSRWGGRVSLRDRLCSFCFAVLSEQDILNEQFRLQALKPLDRLDRTAFKAVHFYFVSAQCPGPRYYLK